MKDFIFLHKVEFLFLVALCSIIINLILRIKLIVPLINKVIDDTLKTQDGPIRRFSGTKITMLTAFASVTWAFHYITIRDGFNETAFVTMACISTGVAITGAYSKKINPPYQKDQISNEEPK